MTYLELLPVVSIPLLNNKTHYHCSKEMLNVNLSFILSIERDYSELNRTPYCYTYLRSYYMFGHFKKNLLDIICVVKESNI